MPRGEPLPPGESLFPKHSTGLFWRGDGLPFWSRYESMGPVARGGLIAYRMALQSHQSQHEAWNPEEQLPVEERRIILPPEFRSSPAVVIVDPRVLQFFDTQPERMLRLSPWQFQEFVAQVLEELGYHAVLGPRGRDGGVDIIADRDTPVGPEVVLVQCKRNAAHKKVGEPVVKQLAMDVTDRGVTRGLIVTTSTFTSVALKYIEQKRHTLSGADYQKLQEWVRIACGRV